MMQNWNTEQPKRQVVSRIKTSVGGNRRGSPNMVTEKVILRRPKMFAKIKKPQINFREQNLNKYHTLVNQAIKMTNNKEPHQFASTGGKFFDDRRLSKTRSEKRFYQTNRVGGKKSQSPVTSKIENQFKGRIKPTAKNAKELMRKRNVQTRQSGRTRFSVN